MSKAGVAHTKFTAAMDAELTERRTAGTAIPAIAEAMHLSPHVVQRRLETLGVKLPGPPKPDPETVKALWITGMPGREIATRVGISQPSVLAWAKKYDWPQRGIIIAPRSDEWTEAEKQIILDAGYDRKLRTLMPLLPGRTYGSIEYIRKVLRQEKRLIPPPKPVREAKPPRVRKAKVQKPVKVAPERKPVAPVQPRTDGPVNLPWPEVKALGERLGISMVDMHDHQRLLRALERMGRPPVYILMPDRHARR